MRKILTLWLLLACAPAFGSIALVQKAQNRVTSATSVAVTLSGVASGDLIACNFGGGGSFSFSSIGDSNGTVSTAVTYSITSSLGFGMFYVSNTNSGTHVITLTVGAAQNMTGFCYEYSGLATSSPLDIASSITTTTSTTISAGPVTTTSNGDLVIMGIGQTAAETFSAFTGGFVEQDSETTGGPSGAWASQIQVSAGSISGGATTSNGNQWASALMAFKAGGPACTHTGITSTGSVSIPNGSTGSFRLKNGAFGTPDCSTVNYRQANGTFGVN